VRILSQSLAIYCDTNRRRKAFGNYEAFEPNPALATLAGATLAAAGTRSDATADPQTHDVDVAIRLESNSLQAIPDWMMISRVNLVSSTQQEWHRKRTRH
jgi:hypothetical protein